MREVICKTCGNVERERVANRGLMTREEIERLGGRICGPAEIRVGTGSTAALCNRAQRHRRPYPSTLGMVSGSSKAFAGAFIAGGRRLGRARGLPCLGSAPATVNAENSRLVAVQGRVRA